MDFKYFLLSVTFDTSLNPPPKCKLVRLFLKASLREDFEEKNFDICQSWGEGLPHPICQSFAPPPKKSMDKMPDFCRISSK